MNTLDVKEIRKKLQLTQEELGNLIGVSRNTIINYEKGGKIPDSKSTILNNLLNENAQNKNIVNEPEAVYETGFDKKIAESKKEIEKIKEEILKFENKIEQDPTKKVTYEKYISSYEEQIFLLNEIINITLEAKKDFLENNEV
ncbi:Helix-turn-helix [Paenimyroides ummariense]|uniref:Helix-turn-helix n=1 Tax=Paenimyroides ummariense TaxID=913024 RepID=A0A1I5E2M0_9FLAO|nr:helix-turn-helix transcriptional regulator [Paenimyroides ummariense]SFO05593.1 Helix-turn-helix [Paenimyroides ummariense]